MTTTTMLLALTTTGWLTILIILTAVAVLAVLALVSEVLRLHTKAELLLGCIADIIEEPDRAAAIARECRADLKEKGLWRSRSVGGTDRR